MFDNRILFSDTAIAPSAVKANRFVAYSGAQAGAGDAVMGVASYDAAAGDAYAVNMVGCLSVEAGAAIAAGQRVKSDVNGCAVPAADADAAAGRAVVACVGPGLPVRIYRFQS